MNSEWLKEWQLYQALRRMPADVDPQTDGPVAENSNTVAFASPERSLLADLWRSVDPPEGRPSPMSLAVSSVAAPVRPVVSGQVLQLSPEVTDEPVDPVFVLVTGVRDGMAMLTAFSTLGVPAALDEFLTGIDEDGLRVLSPWNACWVPLALARRSWLVEMDGASLMEDFASYQEALRAGRGTFGRLSHRMGPPLNHPEDPRWAYYVQEGGKLLRLVETAMRMAAR